MAPCSNRKSSQPLDEPICCHDPDRVGRNCPRVSFDDNGKLDLAMPSVTAKRQCPDLIFVKPRFEVYKAVSQQIREIFAEHTPIIEPLSLDEAYLDVTETCRPFRSRATLPWQSAPRSREVTGLIASAGISYNKFLAKLASDHRKPNGQYVITPEMVPAFVEALPVGKFHGIGLGRR
jgi:DNA polymerase-4